MTVYTIHSHVYKYDGVHVDVYNYNPTLNVYIHATDIIDMHALSLYQAYTFGASKSFVNSKMNMFSQYAYDCNE